MKEVVTVIKMWCDLHDGEEPLTEAEETLTLGLGRKHVEVDVCAACAAPIHQLYGRALTVGRTVSKPYAIRRPRRPNAYYTALREWADQQKLQNKAGNGPAYVNAHGKPDIPPWLMEKFDAAMAEAAPGPGSP